jgi:hypothetical protein
MTTVKIGVLVTGSMAIAVTELPIDEWSKAGVAGVCLFILWWLVARTIPAIHKTHAEALDNLGDRTEKSMGEVKDAIDKGNDKVATLLQSTLVQVLQDRRVP